ncbi:hypothetical protein Efla_007403 [Eimeria flavescens]
MRMHIRSSSGQKSPPLEEIREEAAKMTNTQSDENDKKPVYDEVAFMREALLEARRAAAEGEVPVGCVLVCPYTCRVVGRGSNKTNEKKNASRHCELEAIDDFLKSQFFSSQQTASTFTANAPLAGSKQQQQQQKEAAAAAARMRAALSSLHVYVTCEPCIMCAWALRLCGIQRVFFGCMNSRFGGCGTVLNVHAAPAPPPVAVAAPAAPAAAGVPSQLICKGGICGDEAVELLRQFYSRGNPRAPEDRRKRPLSDSGV